MFGALKRLCLGLGLIVAASSVLLISDWGSRRSRPVPAKKIPVVALLQQSSSSTQEDYVKGITAALAESGFIDGKTMKLVHFNPEGDMSTANLIARQITDGSYDLIITGTTTCLQAVARANAQAKIHTSHIFGTVIDPYIAGVGLKRENPLDKPPYLTGMGTYQPVEEIFHLAHKVCPTLKTVGVVWNPTEINSESCVKRARTVCQELGITLIEAPIEKTSDIREAAASLAGRGAQAFWTGGDAMINTGSDALSGVARAEHIPLFSNTYGHAKRFGGLFDYGANYVEIGRAVGTLGARILNGANPAEIPVTNVLPAQVLLNFQTWNNLKERDKWHLDDDLISKANVIIQPDGSLRKL